MTKNLLNISGKISEPIVKVYELIAEVAGQQNTPFFIIGASARDIIYEYGYDIPAARATKDIDLGIQVALWQAFEKLKEQLISTGEFAGTKNAQRISYQNRLPVDIVPFGAIEKEGNISWPPEHDFKMTVTGFQEVYTNARIVRLSENPVLDIPVVTPVGLMILKIIAWKERYPQAKKDALDIKFILCNYLDAGNQDLLWNNHEDIAVADHDYTIAAAQMLGREMQKIVSPESKNMIQTILTAETGEQKTYRLVEDMSNPQKPEFEQNLALLEALKRGFND